MSSFTIWQYHSDGFWNSYDEHASGQIAIAKARGKSSVILTEGKYRAGSQCYGLYEVLFELNLQRNIETGFCRNVRELNATLSGFDPQLCLEDCEKDEVADLLETVKHESLPAATECNICLSAFSEEPGEDAIRLPKCQGHFFHRDCIEEWLRERHQCPYCKTIYGVITGNCPEGVMYMRHMKRKLPGHTGGLSEGTWMITWDIWAGVQDESHPNPGVSFPGTMRVGYIPDSEPFRKVLNMFRIAWKRRLMFTVGTSLTTGLSDVVIWNGIHVRTEWQNRTGFGWPATEYLASVTEELRAKGITTDQIE